MCDACGRTAPPFTVQSRTVNIRLSTQGSAFNFGEASRPARPGGTYLADLPKSGITIVEAPSRGQPIPVEADPVAVFIGRCLSGPVNQPRRIRSGADFERTFGGDWPHSGLGGALAQFFAHGGRNAIVIRVANNARSAVIDVPTAAAPMRLTAVNPGTGERLRASIDYDGLPDSDTDRFNLTVQRVAPDGVVVTDQEIHRRLSIDPADDRYAATRLLASALVRLHAEGAPARPVTAAEHGRLSDLYFHSDARPASDGEPLTDYDLVGSAALGTGLFALDGVGHFDFLYAPPLAADRAPGAAFLYAAERYCHRRNALLVTDPAPDCDSVDAILRRRARDGVVSPHVLTYYPPVREAGGPARSAAGALIGLMCRGDYRDHVWVPLADASQPNAAALRHGWRPIDALDTDDALRLLRAGINPLLTGPNRRVLYPGLVTAAAGGDRMRGRLRVQRLALFVLRRIARGTRWAVFERAGPAQWQGINEQVGEFLATLQEAGAFGATGDGVRWMLRCDRATNAGLEDGVRFVFGFYPRGSREPLMYTMTHTAEGTRVRRTALGVPDGEPIAAAPGV